MRQLESLIRLTEARAKLELREEATESDAIDVVEIMRASMVDTAADPSMGPNGSLVSSSSIYIQVFPETYVEIQIQNVMASSDTSEGTTPQNNNKTGLRIWLRCCIAEMRFHVWSDQGRYMVYGHKTDPVPTIHGVWSLQGWHMVGKTLKTACMVGSGSVYGRFFSKPTISYLVQAGQILFHDHFGLCCVCVYVAE